MKHINEGNVLGHTVQVKFKTFHLLSLFRPNKQAQNLFPLNRVKVKEHQIFEVISYKKKPRNALQGQL